MRPARREPGRRVAALRAALLLAWRAAPVALSGWMLITFIAGLAPVAAAWLLRQVLDALADGPRQRELFALIVTLALASGARRTPAGPRLPEYVPPGSFLMLGDDPRRSYDSRFAGLIPARLLFGVAVRRIGEPGPPDRPALGPRRS
jgi:Signal peptidase, peptidase S26